MQAIPSETNLPDKWNCLSQKIATRRSEEGRYAVFKVKKDSSCLLLTGGMGCGAESLEIYFKKFDIFKVFFPGRKV